MSAEKPRELKTLASVCPELNMANYTEDDVRHLNDWAIEMSLLVEQYALSQQPATSEPVLTVEREPDYWSGGHFCEGTKPHINPTKVWSLPIGTKLYTHPPFITEGHQDMP